MWNGKQIQLAQQTAAQIAGQRAQQGVGILQIGKGEFPFDDRAVAGDFQMNRLVGGDGMNFHRVGVRRQFQIQFAPGAAGRKLNAAIEGEPVGELADTHVAIKPDLVAGPLDDAFRRRPVFIERGHGLFDAGGKLAKAGFFPALINRHDEASGAVKIFRHTKSAGTEMPLPREPYSARQSSTFIATQNAVIERKVTRGIMRADHDDGRFRTWPARIRLRFTPGFAACNALSFTPNLRVMAIAVSPATTVCVRGAAAVASDLRGGPGSRRPAWRKILRRLDRGWICGGLRRP